MKLLTSLKDLPELQKDNIHIRNEQELLEKINKVIQDGHNKLQIVTDFDHTLTRHTMDDGKTVLTSFAMFHSCPSIPQYYKDEDKRLGAYYWPFEKDPELSIEEKTRYMVEWYTKARGLLIGLKFPRNDLHSIAQNMVECYRTGVADMIKWSEAQQVPVLVFSAGLGESVTAALTAANFLLPHVKVVSNFMDIDENNIIRSLKGELIHTYNKNETAIKNTEYYDMIQQRCNVILLGDSIGDAAMTEGMEHCSAVIKIGFLGHDNLNNYLKHFDIVLVNEPSVDVVNAILQCIQ